MTSVSVYSALVLVRIERLLDELTSVSAHEPMVGHLFARSALLQLAHGSEARRAPGVRVGDTARAKLDGRRGGHVDRSASEAYPRDES